MASPLDQMPDMISKMGVGAGTNTKQMVQDLVQAERAPTEKRLNQRKQEVQQELSGLGKMRSAMSQFRDAVKGLGEAGAYSGVKAESSDSSVASLSAQDDALPGQHTVRVEQLAQGQRLATPSGAFEERSEALGTGRLTLVDGRGEEQRVRIGEEQSTLSGVRDAINEQADGVRASIVDDGEGPRLVLSTQESGAGNAIQRIRVAPSEGGEPASGQAEGGGEGGVGQLAALRYGAEQGAGEQAPPASGMEQLQAAADAVAVIDGMRVRQDANKLEGALQGATLELQGKGEAQVSVEEQSGLAEKNIQGLVDAYNKLRSQLSQLSAYDPESGQAAALQGDATLRSLDSQLSRALTAPVPALAGEPLQSLGDLGVGTERDGSLSLDSARLQEAVDQHPQLVTRLMTDTESGVIARAQEVLKDALGRDSVLDMRKEGLQDRLEGISEERQELDERMAQREEQLREQFSNMNSRVAELNQTSDFLKSRLAGMNQGGKG